MEPKFVSGIQDKHPGSATLLSAYPPFCFFSDLAVRRGAPAALSPGDSLYDATRARLRLHSSSGREPLPHQVCPRLPQGHQVRVQARKNRIQILS
jgi:hypothetical protein